MRRNLMALTITITIIITITIAIFVFNSKCFASGEFYYRTVVDKYLNTAILLITVNDKYKEIFLQSKYLIIKSDNNNRIANIPIDLSYKNGSDLWAVGVIPFYDDWKVIGSDHKDGYLLKNDSPLEQFASFVNLTAESYLGTSNGEKYFSQYDTVLCRDGKVKLNIAQKTKNNYLLVVIFSESEGLIDQYDGKWKDVVELTCFKNIKKVNAMSRSYQR